MASTKEHDFEIAFRQRLAERWNCMSPKGYDESTIAQISVKQRREFPNIYLTFLKICGREAGDLFREYSWKLEDSEARMQCLRTECSDGDYNCPPNYFCFLDYIGDNYWCFDSTSGVDPQIHRLDSWDRWVPLEFKLSDFLLHWDQYE